MFKQKKQKCKKRNAKTETKGLGKIFMRLVVVIYLDVCQTSRGSIEI